MSKSDLRRSRRSAVPALDALMDGAAGDHLRRAMQLAALDRRLRTCLAPALAAHVRLANVDGTRLVFYVDAPVWHARLRLASEQLLDAARSLGLAVDRVVVRVAPPDPPASPAAPAPRPVSPRAHAALRDAIALLKAADDPDPEQ